MNMGALAIRVFHVCVHHFLWWIEYYELLIILYIINFFGATYNANSTLCIAVYLVIVTSSAFGVDKAK